MTTETATSATPSAPEAPGLSVSALVDATPPERVRTVDFVRVLAITVVVLWHWVFSETQWHHGRLVMPNFIGSVPGLWLATWVLQVMPAFFIVGGFSNLASWQSVRRSGGGTLEFWRRRTRRLLRPAAIYIAIWAVLDLLLVTIGGAQANVLHWGMVIFVPLWFLGVYTAVVLLVPLTARLHERYGPAIPLVLVAAMLASGRGYLTTALVWVFCHQLGCFWRDMIVRGMPRSRERAMGLALLGTGAGALGLLTTFEGYQRSMVATSGAGIANMFPTTVCIAALAVLQLGLLFIVRPALERSLSRRRVWGAVVAANGVAMTVFLWHMTAIAAVITVFDHLGGHLLTTATAAWWAWRPFWLLVPGVALCGLVAVFARVERS